MISLTEFLRANWEPLSKYIFFNFFNKLDIIKNIPEYSVSVSVSLSLRNPKSWVQQYALRHIKFSPSQHSSVCLCVRHWLCTYNVYILFSNSMLPPMYDLDIGVRPPAGLLTRSDFMIFNFTLNRFNQTVSIIISYHQH